MKRKTNNKSTSNMKKIVSMGKGGSGKTTLFISSLQFSERTHEKSGLLKYIKMPND
jgi:GTPase SAR1 family protein